jgi:hypothetical protein
LGPEDGGGGRRRPAWDRGRPKEAGNAPPASQDPKASRNERKPKTGSPPPGRWEGRPFGTLPLRASRPPRLPASRKPLPIAPAPGGGGAEVPLGDVCTLPGRHCSGRAPESGPLSRRRRPQPTARRCTGSASPSGALRPVSLAPAPRGPASLRPGSQGPAFLRTGSRGLAPRGPASLKARFPGPGFPGPGGRPG